MKTHLITALTTLYCIGAQAANIEITFTDMNNLSGELYVAVYNSEDAFSKKRAMQSQIVSVYKKDQKVILADVPAGEYSVMVFQDLDGNHQLNTNMLGIPTEPYGFSTNPRLMGPPTFGAIRFPVTEELVAISINME
ncbi:DUF2141 domain-containing protein [Alteromonas confluentis]|uniref:DUF2141 domain-containing protein n=1 Tax=Alteromonas confluentis TaxID=1656094 RepID=A0A1E7ZGG3_9ALTE|nr:DUF2141 domain-containing protein [Alteromonas confluentis]OFC72544.1 hypothetical protein BFC18_03050 [Alteromonas confluentis]